MNKDNEGEDRQLPVLNGDCEIVIIPWDISNSQSPLICHVHRE